MGRFTGHIEVVERVAMERKWLMRTYKDGDEEGIFALWKAVYPNREYDREKWMRWWRWMYQDNPAGGGRIWLADHDGKIVGQYPLIFMNIKIKGEIVRASQNIDLMTHPDYQHQGIFSTLERQALDEAEKAKVYITIGFPNEAAHLGHVKSGWFDIGLMQVMLKPLNWRNVIKLKIKNKLLQRVLATGASLVFNNVFLRTQSPPFVEGLNINQVTSFDDRINDLWAKASSQYQIALLRDKDYLNWRYGAPDAGYSIFVAEKASEFCGYLVLQYKIQSGVKISNIFDMVAYSEEVMHCLLSRAVEDCQRNKADLVLYSLIANKTYHRVLKRNGFVSLPFIKGGRFCAYLSSPSISKEFLSNPQSWCVQLGDSDTI